MREAERTPDERPLVEREAGPSVTFDLTPEEWVELSFRHHADTAEVRKAERSVVVLFIAIVLLASLLGLLYGGAAAALTWLLAGGVGVALLRPLLRGTRKRQFTRLAQAGITNGLFGTHRVELCEAGVLNATEGYEWLVRWSAIERVEDGDGAFLIYNGPSSFMVIPHSAFRDSASLRRFADVFFERLWAARDALAEREADRLAPATSGGGMDAGGQRGAHPQHVAPEPRERGPRA